MAIANEQVEAGIVRSAPGDLRQVCLLYTCPSPRDAHESRLPSSA
ncbi:hypothetical protein [Pseudomonas aeruginosa]|nr:hypothetical protein [Pseudomonas aeruginosa]